MVKVDIFRNTEKQYDIVVLDFERYLGTIEFDYACAYLYTRLSIPITRLLGPKDDQANPFPTDDDICPCLEYKGISLKLIGLLDDIATQKQEFLSAALNILSFLDN